MTTTLAAVRAELASAARYPTQEARLLKAIIVAIDAYLTFKRWQTAVEHVQRINHREGLRIR